MTLLSDLDFLIAEIRNDHSLSPTHQEAYDRLKGLVMSTPHWTDNGARVDSEAKPIKDATMSREIYAHLMTIFHDPKFMELSTASRDALYAAQRINDAGNIVASEQGEPVAGEGYWPGCGSVDSLTKITRQKRVADMWKEEGAQITPLVRAALNSSTVAGEADGWSADLSRATPAATVMVTRFIEDDGEWTVGVTDTPVSKPWTHWRNLPSMPGAPSTKGRDGP